MQVYNWQLLKLSAAVPSYLRTTATSISFSRLSVALPTARGWFGLLSWTVTCFSAVPRLNRTSWLQRDVPHDDRVSPNCWSEIRAQLHSLDFTETHRPAWLINLHYTDNAVVFDFEANYGLSGRHEWRDGTIDCCLPSNGHDYWKKYWANTNTTQYQYRSNPIL